MNGQKPVNQVRWEIEWIGPGGQKHRDCEFNYRYAVHSVRHRYPQAVIVDRGPVKQVRCDDLGIVALLRPIRS